MFSVASRVLILAGERGECFDRNQVWADFLLFASFMRQGEIQVVRREEFPSPSF
jgi:hypothetical protein